MLFRKLAAMAMLMLIGMLLVPTSGAYAGPYCLLRKPIYPPRPNCFEFYLADTAVAPPATMAVVGPFGCQVTAYAARQGWTVDPNFGGPHWTWAAGDAAMSRVGPHHDDFYGCNQPEQGGQQSGGGSLSWGGGGAPCQEVSSFFQGETRDSSYRITREAANIHVVKCGNGDTLYIYEYLNRVGFRVIRPPAWGSAIGGRDFQTYQEALAVAGTGSPPMQASPRPQGQPCPGSVTLLGTCPQ